MTITRQTVADKIAAYLHREITLKQLVAWSEKVLVDGEFEEENARTIAAAIGRLAAADVQAFGLTWEDCRDLLGALGFATRVDVVAEK